MRVFVAHQIEGRTRLRAEVRPVDPFELEALADRLAELSQTEAVEARPTTGSLVIDHPEIEWEDVADALLACGIELVEPPATTSRPNALSPLATGFQRGDALLRETTAGGVDLRTLSFILLVVLGISQLMRGRVLGPASSFLWWALELLLKRPSDSDDALEVAD